VVSPFSQSLRRDTPFIDRRSTLFKWSSFPNLRRATAARAVRGGSARARVLFYQLTSVPSSIFSLRNTRSDYDGARGPRGAINFAETNSRALPYRGVEAHAHRRDNGRNVRPSTPRRRFRSVFVRQLRSSFATNGTVPIWTREH